MVHVFHDLLKETPTGFSIIYVDPPWEYRRKAGQGVIRDYDCMSMDELRALPVQDLGRKDSCVLMWTTGPFLPDAIELLKAWGYPYRTSFCTWVKVCKKGKPILNPGCYTRANAEFLLMGIRKGAHMCRYVRLHNIPNIHLSNRTGRHSEKPAAIRETINALFGDLPRCELFARARSTGWVVWGNQLPPVSDSKTTETKRRRAQNSFADIMEKEIRLPCAKRRKLASTPLVPDISRHRPFAVDTTHSTTM